MPTRICPLCDQPYTFTCLCADPLTWDAKKKARFDQLLARMRRRQPNLAASVMEYVERQLSRTRELS